MASNIPLQIYQDIQSLIEKSYKGNLFTILFGSYARGEQLDDSDVDLIIVYEKAVQPLHEKIAYLNRSFDVFTFDVETLNGVLHNARVQGEFAIVDAVLQGIVLPEETAISRQLKEIAIRVRKAGFLYKDGQRARSYITGLIRDLSKDRPFLEKNMLSVELYSAVSKILLIAGGAGICAGKQAPRALKEINEELFIRLDSSLTFAINEDPTQLIATAVDVLKMIGGSLKEGLRINLPDHLRMPLPVL